MNTAIEYFHSLVEDHFTRDQYEVSYNEGKYNVIITPLNKYDPFSFYTHTTYKRRMERCLEGLIRPENVKIKLVLSTQIKIEHNNNYYKRIEKLLKLANLTNDGSTEDAQS